KDEVPSVLAPRDGRKLDDGEARPLAVHQTGLEAEMRGSTYQVGIAEGLAGFAEQMLQLSAVGRYAVEAGEDQQRDQPGIKAIGRRCVRLRHGSSQPCPLSQAAASAGASWFWMLDGNLMSALKIGGAKAAMAWRNCATRVSSTSWPSAARLSVSPFGFAAAPSDWTFPPSIANNTSAASLAVQFGM